MTSTDRVHPAQSVLNLALVKHVAQHEPCGFDELMKLFGELPADREARLRFQKRLSYLCYAGRLRPVNHQEQRHWCVPQVDAAEPDDAPAPPTDKWVGTVVPPRQHSVMHGALYVPEASPALRAGAHDYQRVPTHGVRC